MTKLEKLYGSIRTLQELGLPLNNETLQAVDELEETLIKKEILPALSENVEPLLKPIQRDLVLVLEYHPGADISVALSRKAKVVETLGAKPLELDPQAQHKEGKKGSVKSHIAPKTGLCVYLPDGSFIQEKKASETFVKAIQRAGVLKVRELGYSYSRVPLVSNTIDKKYGSTQHPVGNGFYVFTNTCTAKKKEQLDRISKALNLGWSVEIVK
jgi:hypothetical protein